MMICQDNREDEEDEGHHPYGVEPLGNIFLGWSSNCRPGGLGTLAVFDVSPAVYDNMFCRWWHSVAGGFEQSVASLPLALL